MTGVSKMLWDLPEEECHDSIPFKIEDWRSVEVRWACRMRTGKQACRAVTDSVNSWFTYLKILSRKRVLNRIT